jgi:hypothetical protein
MIHHIPHHDFNGILDFSKPRKKLYGGITKRTLKPPPEAEQVPSWRKR